MHLQVHVGLIGRIWYLRQCIDFVVSFTEMYFV